ncbi:phosphoribosylformylglycinamidine synthase subunit PurL [candidate division WOR-3 bacterium JGI_Cruoil_03_51_56]|uniref:Phosphoribosylformylglycinamidine synthase subunit PurL n=1 Tax=candidate division WOR-3 bacterium JGI_Cruoil_03_51_56 TaxID=1973747 RepID=A0A235BSC7_UNCW3|nr:MAG: phosphoribosylformylglycinamidine synthase subunit PurL [candidate division WOR-3 bacterium JGI_Cruoil_03_51_56]
MAKVLHRDLQALGLRNLGELKVVRLYFILGRSGDSRGRHSALKGLTSDVVSKVAREIFCDPVSESYQVSEDEAGGFDIEVLYNPGVMDPSVSSILRALDDMGVSGCRVRTGRGYRFGRKLSIGEKRLVQGILMNPVIEHLGKSGEQIFFSPKGYRFRQKIIRLKGKSPEELARLSKERLLALSSEEMVALQGYYDSLGRDPTDVELETFAQTWSEHCQHKTFRGEIDFLGRRIRNLLKSTIFRVTKELNPDWCLSVFSDNSGVIAFDDEYGISFKVETHNHPSALEPYGGATTGIGGVIRDCLGTGQGARPILNTDVFCFAPVSTRRKNIPEGVIHPRQVMRGVVAGVRDYGNRMGIPTANGAVYFDEGFLGNPLVFCGTLGLIPRKRVRKWVRKGQVIVLLGGRTGRDGIHGVTFASLELDKKSQEFSSGAVQIGNPIEEKKLTDLVLVARDLGFISAITDCGGGGLSSAVGELASGPGCEVQLEKVPLKYEGLSPAEIWISEAQERMVVFTEQSKVKKLLKLAQDNDVEATAIGQVTGSHRLVLKYRGHQVADIDMKFLHKGWRGKRKVARWVKPEGADPFVRPRQELTTVLLRLLQAPNIASKEWVVRQYDHEVQGTSTVKPFCGPNNCGPTDACVVTPVPGSHRSCVVSCGLQPRYGLLDPYWMAASAIDEALRNCTAVGGDIERTAILDNFCWGSPERPDKLGGLVRAASACYDIAKAYKVPFISGKDSLYNEFRTGSGDSLPIPSTLLISAVSVIPDGRLTTTADFKGPGSLVYLIGETFEELGGSEYFRIHQGLGRDVPKVDAYRGRRIMKAVGNAIREGIVRACHDVSEGGLGIALAEMAFGGGVGAHVWLKKVPGAQRFRRDDFLLFSESNTRFLCEVSPRRHQAFEALFRNIHRAVIGRTTGEPDLVISGLRGEEVVRLNLSKAEAVWRSALTRRL